MKLRSSAVMEQMVDISSDLWKRNLASWILEKLWGSLMRPEMRMMVGKGFGAGEGEILLGMERIEVLVKTGGVLEAAKDLTMVIGEDFVAKILEHGERVVEAAADGFKGVWVAASFEDKIK